MDIQYGQPKSVAFSPPIDPWALDRPFGLIHQSTQQLWPTVSYNIACKRDRIAILCACSMLRSILSLLGIIEVLLFQAHSTNSFGKLSVLLVPQPQRTSSLSFRDTPTTIRKMASSNGFTTTAATNGTNNPGSTTTNNGDDDDDGDDKRNQIRVLGICGGIGSGKSAACKLLVSELHCVAHIGTLLYFCAPMLNHELYLPMKILALSLSLSLTHSLTLAHTRTRTRTRTPTIAVFFYRRRLYCSHCLSTRQ